MDDISRSPQSPGLGLVKYIEQIQSPIIFTVPGPPASQPRQRTRAIQRDGRPPIAVNYTPRLAPVQAWKATVRLAFSSAYDGPPLNGPIKLVVEFVLARPRSMIWRRRPMPRDWHGHKPDCDNLLKALEDALVGLAYRDDAQIASIEARKQVAGGSEQPHTRVIITCL